MCHLLGSPTNDRLTDTQTETDRHDINAHDNDKLPYSAIPDLRCLGCTDSTTVEDPSNPPPSTPLPLLLSVGELSLSRGSARTAADDLARTHERSARQFVSTNQDSQAPSAAVSPAQLSLSGTRSAQIQGRPAPAARARARSRLDRPP